MIEFEEVIIELSYNCNLSCSMCGFGKEVNPFDKNKFLTFENYKKIVHQIGDKTKTIRLNGRGESTIHPNFVEILDYTKANFRNVNINLFSNFSFQNDKIIKSLIDNQVQLFISIDSPNENELKIIRKGIKTNFVNHNIQKIKNLSPRPFIIFTIQEENIHRIFDIAKFAFDNNCHILYNTIRRDIGIEAFFEKVNQEKKNIINQFQNVEKLYASTNLKYLFPDQLAGIQLNITSSTQTHGTMKNCPALNKELCVFFDGTVTPCNMFNPYIYGNIFKNSLNDIWKSQERLDFLTSHKNHYYCKNCSNLGM